MRRRSPSERDAALWLVNPAALQSICPSRVWQEPVSSVDASRPAAACRRCRSQSSTSRSSQSGKKLSTQTSPSPPVAAAREMSKTAGPLTPYSVNSTSPRFSATVCPPRRRLMPHWALTPFSALG